MKVYRSSLFVIFLLIAQLGIAQSIGFRIEEGKRRVEIPFELHNNLVVIPVVLNNAIPLKFVLDTGVRTAILTEKSISDLMQISYDRKISIVGAGGGDTIDAYIAHQVFLQLPGVQGKGQGMLILDEDYLQLKNTLGVDVHGILGYEIFTRFVVMINYGTRRIVLMEHEEFKPRKKDKVVPISIEDTKPYFYTDLKLGDTTVNNVKLMIDTGASHSILLDPGSNELISEPQVTLHGKLGRGLTGDIIGEIGRVDLLEMEGFSFKQVICSFPDFLSYQYIRETTDRNGTLGAGILTRFSVTFDYMNSRMYLRKNRKYNDPFEYNMSGMDLSAMGPGFSRFVVNFVRTGSPADLAGIQLGDEILMINGVHVKDLDLGKVFNYLSSRQGRKIKVKVKRGTETINYHFNLKRMI